MPNAFGILPTLDGFDVICEAAGRAVDHRPTAQAANGVAFGLNEAARFGQLDRALGCREPLRGAIHS
jgi:hypothetical protein